MGTSPAKVAWPSVGFGWGAAIVIAVGLAGRVALLSLDVFPFNADEAVVGLMARHILQGDLPTFFYGQAYLGSLDAILVAAGFVALGESVSSIRAVQLLLYLATIGTTVRLGLRMGFRQRIALVAGVLLAVPPVVVTLYTAVSLGGYGEALLLGNLLLLGTLALLDRPRPVLGYAGWGLLAGVAFWTFSITLVYSIPCALALGRDLGRRTDRASASRFLAGTLGFLLGALPVGLWILGNGWEPAVTELFGSAIAGASPVNLISRIGANAVNLILFGPTVLLGLRPPWSSDLLGLPFTPIAVLAWVVLVGLGVRRRAWAALPAARGLLLGIGAAWSVGFLLTPFGADPSGRYFLPLAVPLMLLAAVGAGELADRSSDRLSLLVVGALVAFQVAANLQAAGSPFGMTTQFDPATVYSRSSDDRLIDLLRREGETIGYTTYWVSYPLAFVSGEELIFVPHLPYHPDFRYTARDDRYPAYPAQVAGSPRVAYLTADQAWLDVYLRDALDGLEVAYRESTVGPYRLFHTLSRPVRPAELGLGPEAPR